MRDASVSLVRDIGDLAVVGLLDPARRILRFAEVWSAVREAVRRDPPDAALLVDAPDFHLPLSRLLKDAGIPVIFYVGPQVWAWRSWRLSLLRDRTDLVALILPFEKPIYDAAGVAARFVGHPLLDEPPPAHRLLVRKALKIASDAPLIALLPGSRKKEIERHLPILRDAADRLVKRGIAARFAPGGPSTVHGARSELFLPAPFCARDLLAASDAALIASGTAVLEAAVLGVPAAAVYRTDPLSYAAGRYLLSLPYVALPNWIAGKKIVPELLQYRATPEALSEAAQRLLEPEAAAKQKRSFREVAASLGGPGAAERVAAAVRERLP